VENILRNGTWENGNNEGYFLPISIGLGTPFQTSILSMGRQPVCCTNQSAPDDDAQSAIGYWSITYLQEYLKEWPGNFSIKWITGTTKSTEFVTRSDPTDLLYSEDYDTIRYRFMSFTEEPRWQVLSCQPIIEQAEAHVTVARESGHVLDFNLVQEPRPMPEVWATNHYLQEVDGPMQFNVNVRHVSTYGLSTP
jgi:hypothetical protein